MLANLAAQMQDICAISTIAERYGQISYEFAPRGLQRTLDICGLRIHCQGRHVARVSAHDIDIALHWHCGANAPDQQAATVLFRRGDDTVLKSWLSRLQLYRASCHNSATTQ
ncbi:MAG: hypothetical protein V4621_03785 [Pseudomonadota bacterium]